MSTTAVEATESSHACVQDGRRAGGAKTLPRIRRMPSGLRTRIVAWFVVLLALATVAFVLVTREVLLIRLDQRLDSELRQEAQELTKLAASLDPLTGAPFGPRVERVFRVYLEANVPSRNEALISFVDGRPFLRSRQVVPYRLDQDRELVARWAHLTAPDRGRAGTPVGPVEYLAVPVRGAQSSGVFVAAIFRDREKSEVDAAVRAAGAVALAVLVLGSLLALRLADAVVRPVTSLIRAARSISETDLSRRISVQGKDELAQLAETFNAMMGRHEQPDFLRLSAVEVGALTDELHAKVAALAPCDWILSRRGRGVIVADRQRLTQAVVQLAENAVRYGGEEKPIELGSSVARREACFWVRDRGPGIPLEEHERVFVRFRHAGDDQSSEGVGLGLAIVRAIAEAHRGRVELESRPGEGALFRIVIPVVQPGFGGSP